MLAEVATDDAVDLMLAIAAAELDETEVATWLTEWLQLLNRAKRSNATAISGTARAQATGFLHSPKRGLLGRSVWSAG